MAGGLVCVHRVEHVGLINGDKKRVCHDAILIIALYFFTNAQRF